MTYQTPTDCRRVSEYEHRLLDAAINKEVFATMSFEKRLDVMFDPLEGGNDRHHRGRGVNSTQVRAVDRVLRVHVIVIWLRV